MWSKARLVVAWLAAAYLAQMYVSMGWVKFDPQGFWTAAFDRWGYPSWLMVGVGIIEVVAGVLVIIPWIASWAALALVSVMLGALYTRLMDGHLVDSAWITLYIAALIWIAAEFWSWRRPRRSTAAAGDAVDTGTQEHTDDS